MRRYLIIGTGPAGLAAAEEIRAHDLQGEIILIGEEPHGYYSRPGLAYYLTGELPEQGLFPFSKQDFKKINLHILHAKVTQIFPQSNQVELANSRRLSYDRLLIATGAEAARSQIPGCDLTGIVKLDNIADAQNILKLSRKTRSAVVIGGGITALEIVEGLRAQRVKVHYFLRGDRYWGNVLDETESRIIEHRLREEGVKIHFHSEIASVLEKRGRIAGVITKGGEKIKCQMLAIAIGIRPRKKLGEDFGLQTDRGILVNEYLQTNFPNIYAAGDVAQAFDPITKKHAIDSLWGPAREQGRVAGVNMAGITRSYLKSVPFNVTRLAGLTTTIIGTVGKGLDEDLLGIARGDSETWRQLPDAIAAQSDFDVNRLRILVGEKAILGALVMGDQTLSQPLQKLVSNQTDISSIRDALLNANGDLSDILINFWSEWSEQNAANQ